jgi:hypothetical protein
MGRMGPFRARQGAGEQSLPDPDNFGFAGENTCHGRELPFKSLKVKPFLPFNC